MTYLLTYSLFSSLKQLLLMYVIITVNINRDFTYTAYVYLKKMIDGFVDGSSTCKINVANRKSMK